MATRDRPDQGFDITAICQGSTPPCLLGDLEWFDKQSFGPLCAGGNGSWTPCGLGFFAQDRVTVFGGWNRTADTSLDLVRDNAAVLPAVTSGSAECFTE